VVVDEPSFFVVQSSTEAGRNVFVSMELFFLDCINSHSDNNNPCLYFALWCLSLISNLLTLKWIPLCGVARSFLPNMYLIVALSGE
jgi:hypothetical protein